MGRKNRNHVRGTIRGQKPKGKPTLGNRTRDKKDRLLRAQREAAMNAVATTSE